MNRWDRQEDKENVRYSIIMTNEGIKIVDMFTGRMDYINVEQLSLGGSGKANDFKQGFLNKLADLEKQEADLNDKLRDIAKKLPSDNFTSFYNRNFSWKEICESELGIRYLK